MSDYVKGGWTIHDDDQMSEHSSHGSCEGQGPVPNAGSSTMCGRSRSPLRVTPVGKRRSKSSISKRPATPASGSSSVSVEQANRAFAEVQSQHQSVRSDLDSLAGHVAQLTEEQVKAKEAAEQSTGALARAEQALAESSAIHKKVEDTLKHSSAYAQSVAETAVKGSQEAVSKAEELSQKQAMEMQRLEATHMHTKSVAESAVHESQTALQKAEQLQQIQEQTLKGMEERMEKLAMDMITRAAQASHLAAIASAETSQLTQQTVPDYEKRIQDLQQQLASFQIARDRSDAHLVKLGKELEVANRRIEWTEGELYESRKRTTKLRQELDSWNDYYEEEAQGNQFPMESNMAQNPNTNQGTPIVQASTSGTGNSASSVTFPSLGGNGSNPGGSFPVHLENPRTVVVPSGSSFNMTIKPKDPPSFHGKANEDVVTWLAKVSDFLHLTGANEQQQVAYTTTLLLDAAADWWIAMLRERNGRRPENFAVLSALLEKRFGSETRVQRARAELRNIKQGTSEGVRAYSSRFEALIAKLPTCDEEWAKHQYIWGLHPRVAELVTIAQVQDLPSAIKQAEQIEMARQFSQQGNPNPSRQNFYRGRGHRNRGRFAQMQSAQGHEESDSYNASVQPGRGRGQTSGHKETSRGRGGRLMANQCRRCYGYGHWAMQCPSRAVRGRRGGRRGRGRRQARNAALVTSAPNAPEEELQPTSGAPTVSHPPGSGN